MTEDNKELVEIVARAMCAAGCEKVHDKPCDMCDGWFAFYDLASVYLTAIESSGRRIVPVAYTPEMFVAGDQQYDEGYGVREIWAAMLSASPKVTP